MAVSSGVGLLQSAPPPARQNSHTTADFPWRHQVAAIEKDPEEVTRRIAELRRRLQADAARSGRSSSSDKEYDDTFLRCCLRAKKYGPAGAATLVRNYTSLRAGTRWLPGAVRVCALQAELASGVNLLLPLRDNQGNVVISQTMSKVRHGRWHGRRSSWFPLELVSAACPLVPARGTGRRHEPALTPVPPTSPQLVVNKTHSIGRYQCAGFYLLHRALQQPTAQTHGAALLLDFGGFSFTSMLAHIGPSDLRRGVAMMQDSAPAHLNVIYLLHPPKWLARLLAMLRPLLRKDSLKQKFVLLERVEALFEHIPAASLPEQLGGTLQYDWPAQLEAWEREEEQHTDFDVTSLIS